MKRTPLAVVCLAATALAGCDSGQMTAPDGRMAPDDASQSVMKPMHTATGGGWVYYDQPGYVGGEQYGFDAALYPDGSVTGELQMYWEPYDERVHGEVYCLAVDGDVAAIGITITKSSSGLLEGVAQTWVFTVQDNGEGVNGPPDLLGSFIPTGGNPGVCSLVISLLPDPNFAWLAPQYEWSDGNIDVN